MLFEPPLQPATLLRRYKRFLADVTLPSGETITLHCPNTGSMKNCVVPGSECWFSGSTNPKRKYPNTWEIATTVAGGLAGVNTHRANALVTEALGRGLIPELLGFKQMAREVRYGHENSRIDFLLSFDDQLCYVEVKNVTLVETAGQGLFPDAVSLRAVKHLRELQAMVKQGHRAVIFFCAQLQNVGYVAPADHIDPRYGDSLRQAAQAGVETMAYRADLSPGEIVLAESIPVIL